MTWANSVHVERASSMELSDNVYLVHWKGGDYSIQKKGLAWWIRSRATCGVLNILYESEGLGKEEAIAWIEKNL